MSIVRELPSLWGYCEYHQVLVKVGTLCSACERLGPDGNRMGATGMRLRGEYFEIGEPQPGWTTEKITEAKSLTAPQLQGGANGSSTPGP